MLRTQKYFQKPKYSRKWKYSERKYFQKYFCDCHDHYIAVEEIVQ